MTEQKNKTRDQAINSLQRAVQEHKSNLDVNYDYLRYASRTSGKLLLRDTTKNLIASTVNYLKKLETILADIEEIEENERLFYQLSEKQRNAITVKERREKNKNLIAVEGRVKTVLSLAVKICKCEQFYHVHRYSQMTMSEISVMKTKLHSMEHSIFKTLNSLSVLEAEKLGILLATSQNEDAKRYILDRGRAINLRKVVIDTYEKTKESIEKGNTSVDF